MLMQKSKEISTEAEKKSIREGNRATKRQMRKNTYSDL
jgi:hypothetical protein